MSDHFVLLDLIDTSPFAHLCPANEENIESIRADLESGGKIMTPLHAIPVSERWELLTGHDRLEAAKRAGLHEVPVSSKSLVLTDGEKVSYVVRDNRLRKEVSPRPAVEWYLKDDPKRSNVRIANGVGCSVEYVRQIRGRLEESGAVATVATRVGKDGVSQPAHNARTPKPPTIQNVEARDVIPIKARINRAINQPGGPEASASTPKGINLQDEVRQANREVARSPWGKLTKYIVDRLDLPPNMNREAIREVMNEGFSDGYVRTASMIRDFLSVVIEEAELAKKEVGNAAS